MILDITKVANIIKDNEFNPIYGLPEDLFLYVSTLIPMVNVDLLIKNEKNETLLSWRDDEHTGIGWHIPGGIIRYKEKAEDRIRKVALSEIGFFVNFDKDPIAINEIIANEKSIRGHFISLLYKCFLPSSHLIDNKNRKEDDAGYLRWHEKCPDNLLCYHEIYREYIFSPKVSSERKEDGTIVSHSFEDMYPFLSEEEVKSNMIGGN